MAGLSVPLDEVVHFDADTSSTTTGGESNADSTPVFRVYEEDNDTAILGPTNMTLRTGLTGGYRGTFTASAANGFDVGKWYIVKAFGTVGGVNGKATVLIFRLTPAESSAGVPKVDPSHWGGTAVGSTEVRANIINIAGSAVSQSGGLLNANVTQVSGDSTAADNLEAILDGTGGVTLVASAFTLTTPITANMTQISGDTTAADTLEAMLDSQITGTADSGTTTTMVDSARTEADADYWAGSWIMFTSGTISGQTRLITGFTPGTDTITFAPATTQAVSTNTYEIIPAAKISGVTLVDTTTTNTDMITAAGIRTAVGLASANLDTQLADLPTVAEFEARTLVAANYGTAANQTTLIADTTQIKADLPTRPARGVQLDDVMFMMVDATDGKTPETGITVTATISKDGGAFAACTNAVSEVSGGFYKITLTATELTANSVALKMTGTGCAQTNIAFRTQPT
jgi:hypothetical protein